MKYSFILILDSIKNEMAFSSIIENIIFIEYGFFKSIFVSTY